MDKCDYGHYLNENNKHCYYCKKFKIYKLYLDKGIKMGRNDE